MDFSLIKNRDPRVQFPCLQIDTGSNKRTNHPTCQSELVRQTRVTGLQMGVLTTFRVPVKGSKGVCPWSTPKTFLFSSYTCSRSREVDVFRNFFFRNSGPIPVKHGWLLQHLLVLWLPFPCHLLNQGDRDGGPCHPGDRAFFFYIFFGS